MNEDGFLVQLNCRLYGRLHIVENHRCVVCGQRDR